MIDSDNDYKNISKISSDRHTRNLFCVEQGIVRYWDNNDNTFEERGEFTVGTGVSAIEPMSPDDNNIWLATATNEKVLSLWSKD